MQPAVSANLIVSGGSVRSRRARRFGVVVLLLAALGVAGWINRATLLTQLAATWIVSDPIVPAEAAVVLGGGLDTRPFAAAELYRKGLVQRVLISNVKDEPAVALGVLANHTELNRRVLLRLGVPADKIETFGENNESTWDEAVTLSSFAARRGIKSFTIPVELFSSRRVAFIFRRELPTVTFAVEAVDHPEYARGTWWRSNIGLIAFQNEFVKYVYYRLTYH